MIWPRTIVVSSAVFCALFIAEAQATPNDPKYYGSIYPDDTVQPVETQPAAETPLQAATRRVEADENLVKALGAAGYLIVRENAAPDFNAFIRRAVGRHPAFHAQASTMEEADAERRRARAALYPQLSTQLRGDYSITRDFAPTTDNVVESLRPREQFTAGVSASQLVFDGGATINRIRSARALSREYENALSTRINDLAVAALTAYHDVAAHQALSAFSQGFIARQREILEDVKERERLGAGSKADVTRAEARLAAARARLAEISESQRVADIRYEEFFGAVAPAMLARPALNPPGVDSRNEAVAFALSENPEVAAAEARADARQADFKASRASRLPEVRLSVDAVKFDVFESGDDFDVRAGVNLNYNIFGGGREASIAAARSRARREKFNEEQVRQDVAREAAMAFERLRGADDRLAALAEALVAHDITRDLVLERYKLSRGDLIDVLQAENDYFEAGVAYIIALSARDMANYALMEQTGVLLVRFSPEAEYEKALGELGR